MQANHQATHHQRSLLVLEVNDRLVTVVLVLATVQRQAEIAVARQLREQVVAPLLRVHKHEHVASLVPQPQQL